MKQRAITHTERTALLYLAGGGSVATHWIAKACGFGGPDATSGARRLMRRLLARGLVEAVTARSGYIYWWKITAAGRLAVAS